MMQMNHVKYAPPHDSDDSDDSDDPDSADDAGESEASPTVRDAHRAQQNK
jgi:hypothetical protein